MPSLNRVCLMGYLGSDPEPGKTRDMARVALATNRRIKEQSGEVRSETQWHRLVLFGHHAKFALEFLKRGCLVYAEGRLNNRHFTGSDAVSRTVTEIVVDSIQNLTKTDAAGSSVPASMAENDIPF